MGTVYAFFADGFEEIEAFTAIDTLRRAGLNVEIVSVTPDEIVVGAHDVSVLCDINFENCDFFDAELLLLPGVPPSVSAEPNRAGEQPWQLQYTLLCFGLSLLGAALITLLIEKPCAKVLKKMFARGKAENKA